MPWLLRGDYMTTLGGEYYEFIDDLLNSTHILIAGTTGSGKSVLMNDIIYTLCKIYTPEERQMILIDPKRVELSPYKNVPHCMMYANDSNAFSALDKVINIMELRYKNMELRGQRKWQGMELYVFIDEFADLMLTNRKLTEKQICRLAQLGRAAGIHLIIATQRPTRDIITGTIKCNIDTRIALRCPTAQDSRNIINIAGAEELPRYGRCIMSTPEGYFTGEVPYIAEDEQRYLIDYYLGRVPQDELKRRLQAKFG